MLRFLYSNHVFANLAFAVILVIGFLCYGLLPRQQDPDMNFNWITIYTVFPGASAEDVEKLVTIPLEEAVAKVPDIRYAFSNSRLGFSSILVRFNDIDPAIYDKRMNDLRREIANQDDELPQEAEEPDIIEITSSNAYPTVTVAVIGAADDENLRFQARYVEKDLERLTGVDTVMVAGLRDPELQVQFQPELLLGSGVTPSAVADSVAGRFRDISGGTVQVGQESWLLRMLGTTAHPEELANWPLLTPQGELPLDQVARVERTREKPSTLVRVEGKPAVLLSVTKQSNANSIELTQRVNRFVEERNQLVATTGVKLMVADDQTHMVVNAIRVMEGNALLGLALVVLTAWFFLGSRIAVLIGFGIPFSLAATFGLIYASDGSLNVMVLLGVVIALGMLVDDAVVVVDAIRERLLRGMDALDASIGGMREVFAPVVSSVLTTIAAFLPLMLLPGILGKYMRVIPLVVTASLLISLVEAFWMLPTHIVAMREGFSRPSRLHQWREGMLRRLRKRYTRVLIQVLRHPKRYLTISVISLGVAIFAIASGMVRNEFFAMDPFPLFYVNLEMPPSTSIEQTIAKTLELENKIVTRLRPGEARSVISYAGQMFTETEPLLGDRYGQIMISLVPEAQARRSPLEIIAAMRPLLATVAGPVKLSFTKLTSGPPLTKPISVKVRGERFAEIIPAVQELRKIMAGIPAISDIIDNYAAGQAELALTLDNDALRRSGADPGSVIRLIRLLADGEVVASFQSEGEKIEVRVLAAPTPYPDIDTLLRLPVELPQGGSIALGALVKAQPGRGSIEVRHYNFRRAITVEADLDKVAMDTVAANQAIREGWERVQANHPGVSLDFSGELDDIYESMDAILTLFILGIGLIYMILGAQFKSYWQPFLVLTTVPMAFTGVIYGLLFSRLPLSLYTMYGVVALSGIAVNSAIVLISAANDRRELGMSTLYAIIFAAKRRVVPILITSVTTIAGLLSLAVGLGGYSLLWGPVAASIVWGLSFSTFLTLFLVPLLYWMAMRNSPHPPGDR